MTTRKCERYARERHANVKSLHACVFLLSNSEKLIEKIFETTLRQNNTKIWAAYGITRVECSWPAIIKFFTFKVGNIVFADIFVFLHTKKTTVLSYNRLCFQVQILGALNQF